MAVEKLLNGEMQRRACTGRLCPIIVPALLDFFGSLAIVLALRPPGRAHHLLDNRVRVEMGKELV